MLKTVFMSLIISSFLICGTQKIGNTYFHDNGTSTQKIGNTYFHSNGTSSQKIGNTMFGKSMYGWE